MIFAAVYIRIHVHNDGVRVENMSILPNEKKKTQIPYLKAL